MLCPLGIKTGTVVQPRPQPLPPIVPVSAHEWRWLAFVVILGAAIRLLYLDRVAVEHFDEGVYAANVWFGAEEGYQYPLRQFYAPPLLPTVIEWCYVIWGMTGIAPPAWLPMVPGLLCGIATIPSAWWVARRWFGPTAGYAAMWLVSLNEFHAAYSRTALTDVPVTLAILWSVFAAWKLLLDPTVKHGVITGLLTAIAWWLKYSGWLPLAILLVGGAVFQCLIRPEERRWKAWISASAVAVLTAGVLWLPVLSDCQSVGGYSAVVANHRGYIMGWSHWGANFVTLGDCFATYSEHQFLVWYLAGLLPVGYALARSGLGQFVVLMVFVLTGSLTDRLVGGYWYFTVIIGFAGVGWAIWCWRRAAISVSQIAACALASTWYCGLTLMTPVYQPYPRLMLPLWMSSVLLAAWCVQQLDNWLRGRFSITSEVLTIGFPDQASLDGGNRLGVKPAWRARFGLTGPLLVGVILLALGVSALMAEPQTWEYRTWYASAAAEIGDKVIDHSNSAIVQVYGLPPVVLALRERGVAAVVCGGPEAAARLEGAWLVVSSDADRDSTWNERWQNVADQFELVRSLDLNPSSIVRLDHGPLPPDPPPVELRLYRRR